MAIAAASGESNCKLRGTGSRLAVASRVGVVQLVELIHVAGSSPATSSLANAQADALTEGRMDAHLEDPSPTSRDADKPEISAGRKHLKQLVTHSIDAGERNHRAAAAHDAVHVRHRRMVIHG